MAKSLLCVCATLVYVCSTKVSPMLMFRFRERKCKPWILRPLPIRDVVSRLHDDVLWAPLCLKSCLSP